MFTIVYRFLSPHWENSTVSQFVKFVKLPRKRIMYFVVEKRGL